MVVRSNWLQEGGLEKMVTLDVTLFCWMRNVGLEMICFSREESIFVVVHILYIYILESFGNSL
jgi:hypothetical protein